MTSVSFSGDQDLKNALSIIARRRKTSIGQLVLDAVLAAHGDEIEQVQAILFGNERTSENKLSNGVRNHEVKKPA